ncbi:MAG: hypothetical protein H0Z28_10155 [Archaeoglobus sp.]|nr:hypothetical protein [Archaeoglobus sp.]
MNRKTKAEIRDFCKRIIVEHKRISLSELFELCRERFVVRSKQELGYILSALTNNGSNLVKYRGYINGRRETIYALRNEKRSRRCLLCGEKIPWRSPFRFCNDCFPKAESIANFFIPIPEVIS